MGNAKNYHHQGIHLQLRLPRTLLLWWSLWLLAAWVLAFGWSSPFLPSLRAYGSSLSKLLFLVSLGLAIVWPLFRLSAQNRGAPRIVALVDFVAIVITLQVILWPMRISGQWEVSRLFALDWSLSAWALIIAGIIAFGSVPPRVRFGSMASSTAPTPHTKARNFIHANAKRGIWMFVIILLSLLGPTLSILLNNNPSNAGSAASASTEAFLWSPISSAWWMGAHTLDAPERSEWLRLILISIAGILIWVGLLIDARLQSIRRNQEIADAAIHRVAGSFQPNEVT